MDVTGAADIKTKPLDLRLLHTFVTVVSEGNISRAAQRLCRSQSAVSEQLAKLEEALCVSLLIRERRGVAPTAAGRRLLPHAREMMALSELAHQDMAGAELTGELHLGITDYFQPASIAPMLQRIQYRCPGLKLRITVCDSASIASNEAHFDIGLTMRLLNEDGPGAYGTVATEGIKLRRESLVWAASASFDTRDCDTIPLVVLDDTCNLRRHATSRLDAAGVAYEVRHCASGVAGVQAATLAGLGITCLNDSARVADMVDVGPALGLPAMPAVEFWLTPPRTGEMRYVTQARQILASYLR